MLVTFVCPVHYMRSAEMHKEQVQQGGWNPHGSCSVWNQNRAGKCISLTIPESVNNNLLKVQPFRYLSHPSALPAETVTTTRDILSGLLTTTAKSILLIHSQRLPVRMKQKVTPLMPLRSASDMHLIYTFLATFPVWLFPLSRALSFHTTVPCKY